VRLPRLAILAVVLAGCGSEPPRPEPEPEPRAAPVATAAPQAVAVIWGLDRPGRAARRLRRHPDVASVTATSREVALLRSAAAPGGRVVQRVRPRYAVPLDVLAVDPRGYAAALPEASRRPFARLRRGEALLSRTSARLRRVGRGGTLRLTGGRRLRVAGVIDDEAASGAELVVPGRRGGRAGLVVLLRPGAAPDPMRLARRAERGAAGRLVGGGGPAGPARPAELKARFGEPAVALPYGWDWVRLDPAFVRRRIVTRRVPLLGTVTCHRAMIGPLRAALGSLERRGLGRLVDPADYAGCYAPRRIQPSGSLSLHAWGLAVDLNATANPFGGRSRQDRRLVRAMERQGFTWGGDWPTRPDPMHFELRGG
jgi:hypothetical protein